MAQSIERLDHEYLHQPLGKLGRIVVWQKSHTPPSQYFRMGGAPVRRRIDEELIRLAVQIVECKNEIQFTERIAVRWAELNALIIAKYGFELVALREKIDSQVNVARDLISDRPDALSRHNSYVSTIMRA